MSYGDSRYSAPPPYQKKRPVAQPEQPRAGDRRLFENASGFTIHGGEFNAVGGSVYHTANDMRYGTNYNGRSTHNQTEYGKGGTFNGQEFNFGDRAFNGPTNNYSGTTSYQSGSAHMDQRGAQEIQNGVPMRENLGYEKSAQYRRSSPVEGQQKNQRFRDEDASGKQEERVPPRNWDSDARDPADNRGRNRQQDAEARQYQQNSPAPGMAAGGRNSPPQTSREITAWREKAKSAFISCIESEPRSSEPPSNQIKSKKHLIMAFKYYMVASESEASEARSDLNEAIAEYTKAHRDTGNLQLRKSLFRALGRYLDQECQAFLVGFLDVCEDWKAGVEDPGLPLSLDTMQTPPVLIVGAGPSGLVLALSLLQNGVHVRIIEKDSFYHLGQRGAGVMPRTLELYNFLGILPEIFEHSADALPMQNFEIPGGKVPLKKWRMVPVEEPTPAVPWPNVTIIGQDKAESILRDAIQSFGVQVELGTRLVSFVQNNDYVEATLSKLVNGQEIVETTQVKWLIGADGGRSTVRKQLALGFLGESRTVNRAERTIIADVHVTGLDMDSLHLFGGDESGICTLPIWFVHRVLIWPTERKDSNIMTVYARGPDADYEAMAKDYSAFKSYVEAKLGRPDIVLGKSTWLTDFSPNIRMVDKFQVDRVFLTGDAAHVHSLTGGQGLNTSIQDSFNLGWKLALVHKGLSPRSLLQSYTQERLPVVVKMLNITTTLLEKYHTTTTDHSGWKRGGSLGQLGVNYRWSEVVVDGRVKAVGVNAENEKNAYGISNAESISGTEEVENMIQNILRAGDRAPDAPELELVDNSMDLHTKTSLFKLYGTSWHTVLIFSPFPEVKVQGVLGKYSSELFHVFRVVLPSKGDNGSDGTGHYAKALVDTQGYVHKHFGVGAARINDDQSNAAVVVVRPDGMIGAITLNEDDLKKYCNLVFEYSVVKS
ncbi:hypothetical protein D9757_007843 [Collybiopsis confluens]|uniref:FAD-binding domain-containing protein n=1 Tax=Collybiopsis confluens TaxID=2823264 RepID=A0A8H5M590_9AGAR|nr:hypothetical protein D9757_007843 [Collybiopsis confluens]